MEAINIIIIIIILWAVIIIFNIIVGFIFIIFRGGAAVRGGLNWAVAVENCGGKGYNGSRREIP